MVVVVVVALAPLFVCVADGKIKSCFFSLDLGATVSDLLGDDVSVSVTWILTALVESCS